MRYPTELYRRADEVLTSRRQAAQLELDRRKLHIREDYPDIWQIRSQVSAFGARMGKSLLAGNVEESDRFREEMKQCISRYREMLTATGLSEDYLEPPYTCLLCKDRGHTQDGACKCRQQLLHRLTYEMLSNTSKVDECSFDNFDLTFYESTTIKQMEKLLASCKRYARDFTMKSPNLLFMGPTGLGKTHLSLAIARSVVDKGHLVMYASASSLLGRLVDVAFGDETGAEYRELVYGCDLLIIDDLGTEFKTHITKSEVYSLLNTRLIEGRPTIINTNLGLADMESTYDARVVSRLIGSYSINQFAGKDIRYQKRRNQLNEKIEKTHE